MISCQTPDMRQMEKLHAQGMETYSQYTEPKDYETGRYGEILNMVRRGACFEEVRDWYAEHRRQYEGPLGIGKITQDVYDVYVKIANGTTANCGKTEPWQTKTSGAHLMQRVREMASTGFSEQEIGRYLHVAYKTVRAILAEEDDA